MKRLDSAIEKGILEAIRLEINGRHFFEKAEEITENPLGKKMFRKLAAEEVKHLVTFGKLFASVINNEEWQDYVDQEEKEGKSPVIEELEKRMTRAEGKGDVEALRIGMELETKAIDFFSKMSADSTDPRTRSIFNEVIDEERFHYDLLQAQYDSVTNSGFWMDAAEFQMDGKY